MVDVSELIGSVQIILGNRNDYMTSSSFVDESCLPCLKINACVSGEGNECMSDALFTGEA